MAKKNEEPIDLAIVHPEPDTSPTEAKDGEPPPTWNPTKHRRRPDDRGT